MSEDDYPPLTKFGTVWNGGEIPTPLFERETELQRIVDQIETAGRSFILLGPSGVGKSTLLQNAAFRLSSRPENPWQILETSTSFLVAGKKYIGEWQEVIHEMVVCAQRSKRIAIWFTDFMYLVGAGKVEGSDDNMASSMAALMDRREILLFGECTPETFKSNLEPHMWFTRLLDLLHIEPHSAEINQKVICQAAQATADETASRHGCVLRWTPEAVQRLQQFGDIYFPGVCAPAGAMKLVQASLEESTLLPHLLQTVESTTSTKSVEVPLTSEIVVQSLSKVTGTPRKMLDDSMPLDLSEVRRFFQSKLVGQRKAIDVVVDLIALIKAGLTDPTKPLGVLLFVGPTGVGKTELAKSMAEFVFGSSERLIRLDMSEYQEYGAVEKIVGSRFGSDPPGGLLSRVRQHPFSVVLLDEIEKAHPSVFDLMLQLLDAGRLTRASGETINFTQTVIILTSNLGATDPELGSFGFGAADHSMPDESIRDAIQQFFRPELVNRIGEIVVFHHLSRDEVRSLAMREVGSVLLRSGITRRKLQVDVDRGVIDVLCKAGYDPRYGARPLKRAVERLVLAPLARYLSQMDTQVPPTLIQLYPAGESIRLRSIDDARTRRQQTVPQVSVVDPIDGRRKTWDKPLLVEAMGELESALKQLHKDFEENGNSVRRSELVKLSGAPDFWDNPQNARLVLTELYRIERLREAIQELGNQIQEVSGKIRSIHGPMQPQSLDGLAAEIEQNQRQASLVRFALLCNTNLQRSDAFLVLEAIDAASSFQLPRLAESYENWSKRLGFQVTLVHEETLPEGELKQIVIKIEGVAVYGALVGEQGLHEFDTTSPSQRMIVKVTVLPIVEGSLDDSDIETTKRAHRGRGKYIDTFRSEVCARHRTSGHQVTICNGLDGPASELCAKELLAAEIERQRLFHRSASDNDHSVVRRWWLGKQPNVRDPRTNVTIRRLKDIDAGHINPFLLGWLERK